VKQLTLIIDVRCYVFNQNNKHSVDSFARMLL